MPGVSDKASHCRVLAGATWADLTATSDLFHCEDSDSATDSIDMKVTIIVVTVKDARHRRVGSSLQTRNVIRVFEPSADPA